MRGTKIGGVTERLFVQQNGGEVLGEAHYGVELCWRDVWGSIRDTEVGRSGQTLWSLLPDDSSIPFLQEKRTRMRTKEKEKIRLPQDLVWIKVTHPQIVARQCLREVSQEGRGWSL